MCQKYLQTHQSHKLPCLQDLDVSIVIPTKNRCALLSHTLESITNQETQSSYEVVIIDDGSTDATASVVDNYRRSFPLQYQCIKQEGFGIARPKNAGALLARGKVIIFLDSGIIISPQFVESHLQFHAAHPSYYVIGFCHGTELEDPSQFHMDHPIEWNVLREYSLERANICDTRVKLPLRLLSSPWVYFWGGNASVHKRDLFEAGMFDENFSGWGFEDIELGYRLHMNGLRFGVAAEGWGFHLPHPRSSLSERLASAERNWRYAVSKHSDLRIELFWATDILKYETSYSLIKQILSRAQNLLYPDVIALTIESRIRVNSVDKLIVIGAGGYQLGSRLQADSIIDPFLTTEQSVKNCLPLIGIAVPYNDNTFDVALITDIWKFTHITSDSQWPTFLEYMLIEAGRIARRLVIIDSYLSTVKAKPPLQQNFLAEVINGVRNHHALGEVEIIKLHTDTWYSRYV